MELPLFASREGRKAPPIVSDGGEAGEWGDQSRVALLRAVELGADGVALSVRLTRDGVPVLLRLPRTGSVARENRTVAESGAAELGTLRLKAGEPPLFLEEALSLLPPSLPVLLCLLVPGSAAASAPLLGPASRPTALLSPLRDELLAAEEILPGVPRVLVTGRPSLSDGAFCARRSCRLSAAASTLTPIRAARLTRDGVSFMAWKVETASLRDRAVSLGAFALLTRHLSRLLLPGTPSGGTDLS